MDSIGGRIKFARKQKGLTQTDIQRLTGISSGNLSDIENDKSMPSASALISLSRELEVSIDWILTGKEFSKQKAVGNSKDLLPEEIEFIGKFRQLTKENQIKVEGIVEGLLLGQANVRQQNGSVTSSRSTNGNGREEAAARSESA